MKLENYPDILNVSDILTDRLIMFHLTFQQKKASKI